MPLPVLPMLPMLPGSMLLQSSIADSTSPAAGDTETSTDLAEFEWRIPTDQITHNQINGAARSAVSGPAPFQPEETESATYAAIQRGEQRPLLVTFRSAYITVENQAGSMYQQQSSSQQVANSLSQSFAGASLLHAAVLSAHAAVKLRVMSEGGPAIRRGAQLVRDFLNVPVSVVAVNSLAAVEELMTHKDVISVEPAGRVYAPMLNESLPLIHQPGVLVMGAGGNGCVIAVLDTGAMTRLTISLLASSALFG